MEINKKIMNKQQQNYYYDNLENKRKIHEKILS